VLKCRELIAAWCALEQGSMGSLSSKFTADLLQENQEMEAMRAAMTADIKRTADVNLILDKSYLY